MALAYHSCRYDLFLWMHTSSFKSTLFVRLTYPSFSPYSNSNTHQTGYIGGSFWGAFFIVMSGNRLASLITAIIFCLAMLVSLKFSPNKTMVCLNLGFIALTITFIVIDRFVVHPFLQYLTLFYGVFISSFSIFDIYDDLITRTVDGSDAHACHKLIPCCLPRCVGVQFALVALSLQALGLYLGLVWMSSTWVDRIFTKEGGVW